MAMLPGFAFKVRVNGALYTATEVDVDDDDQSADTTNSEGTGAPVAVPGFNTSTPCNLRARVTVRNASFDPAENPFAAPRNVRAGSFIELTVYTDGVGSESYDFPSFHVQRTTYNPRAPGNGLQPFSFEGESVGPYTDPAT
jgi:hypothetical protein